MSARTTGAKPVARTVADSARLFVALWPDADIRVALQAARALWKWEPGATVVRADRLHLTLHFLGDLPRERIPELTRALKLPFARCALTLDRGAVWRGGVAVLEPTAVPASLVELQRALGAALHAFGLPLETRPWRPHVTLARRSQADVPPVAPLVWPLHGHALVESRPHPNPRYEVIARFA